MSDYENFLQRLQTQRAKVEWREQNERLRKIFKAVAAICATSEDNRSWDAYDTISELVLEYGAIREKYGYWNAAVQSEYAAEAPGRSWAILSSLQHAEKQQKAEYEHDAKASAQAELLDPDEPDHLYDARCDNGHGTG